METPETRLDYEQVFQRACNNVVGVWCGLEDALTGRTASFLDSLKDWNLDTGRTVPDAKYVFWGAGMTSVLRPSLLAACVLAGAPSCTTQDNSRQMFATASALTKLSSSVEATTLFRNPAANLTDSELLRLATASDPELLRPFEPFTVRVRRHEQGVVLLVCQPNGGAALLEDASCTARLDRHHWRDDPSARGEFTLKMPDVCAP